MTHVPRPLALALLLAGLFAAGCGGISASGRSEDAGTMGGLGFDAGSAADGGGTAMEAGTGAYADAAAGPEAGGLANTPVPATTPSTPGRSDGYEGGGGDPRTCYDGLDNNAASGVDCQDPLCSPLASCCIGRGDCCAAVASSPLPASLAFGTCGTSVATCAPDATAFGPGTFMGDGGFYPGGNASSDGGLRFDQAVDLTTHRATLTATFLAAAPLACDPATCIDGVAVGFTTQADLSDSNAHVVPLAALLYSGVRRDVSLLVGDTVVGRWPADGDRETWQLDLLPTGEVRATRMGDGTSHTATFAPDAAAHLVLFGRSRNPAAMAAGARLGALQTTVDLCDMPSAWEPRTALQLTQAGTDVSDPLLGAASGADVAFVQGQRYLVFPYQGTFLLARGSATDDTSFELSTAPTAPALAPTKDYEAGGIADPVLIADGDGVALFYTAVDGAGRHGIARAEASSPGSTFTEGDALEIDPSEAAPASDGAIVVGLDAPTVAVALDGTWVLVARATLRDGSEQLRAFVATGGVGWSEVRGSTLPGATRTGTGALVGGADALGRSSLIVHDRAWQLYYGWRRGTRWKVGLLSSDELLGWRSLGDTVLGPGGNGFDRLGVRAPSAVSAGDRVLLYFAGLDGAQAVLARTAHDATDTGTVLP